MQVDLKGRVAIVTGGAQGIGRAIVEQLAANGAAVALVDVEIEVARETAAEIERSGGRVWAVEGDVANGAVMAEIGRDVAARLGGVDLLVNNAGINTRKDRQPIQSYSDEDWDLILRVDLTGVFTTSKAIVPRLLERGGGRVVNIASIAGIVPLRLQSAYVAAKAGVINLTKSMALELGPQGVLCNAVAPGSIMTRGTRALFYGADGSYSQNAQSLISHIPVGRPGNPEEIAYAVLFLCAPESSYVNGAVLTVDGGWTAGFTRDW